MLGFVAYEAAPAFDPALNVAPADPAVPLAWFAVFPHPEPSDRQMPAATAVEALWHQEPARPAFDAAIAGIRAGIADGCYYQVNYTGRNRSRFAGDAQALFVSLRQAQPDGYGCFIEGGDWQLLSVSPELFFDWQADGTLTTRPMKGTAPRGADTDADQDAAQGLLASEKERAENLMIVDLLRNDLSRIAVTGSVAVPRLFQLEALPTAWQMTSTVQCRTRPDTGLADVFRALFPCGSVTGAPKAAAMAAIANLEPWPRGIYCGAVGLIRPGGHATFSVGIRSLWLDRHRGEAECGIGSGITLDSTAAGEYAEWQVKRRFLWRASAGFQILETLRLEQGRLQRLEGHCQRMQASAEYFGFPLDREWLTQVLNDLATRHACGTWRIRLLLDRHGHCRGEAHPFSPSSAEVSVVLADSPVAEDDEFLRHKTTRRQIYAAHTPPPGAFDTLLWNRHGHLTEFTRGNLLVELEGRLLTPPLSDGLLPGVLRGELLARGEIAEASLPRSILAGRPRLWFINSLRGRLPARLVTADS